ncbi:hypothetical protein [Pelobacter propionicus]|uniref:hypothetical protein n=1 Tax=Pelobacter propionicus TaxID=29543 RepID=UPI0005A1E968|nr:hypothetical protein [Pelobacter propionicus]
MGQAKRRVDVSRVVEVLVESGVIAGVSSAIRRLAGAASGSLGTDCYTHAILAQSILDRLRVASVLKAGYAAWRVGDGNSDVVAHAPVPGIIPQPGGFIYHAWLEIGYHILDFTTYLLPLKASQLDALDGGSTTVDWAPPYLLAQRKSVSTMKAVTLGKRGLYYYEFVQSVTDIVLANAQAPDPDETEAAWMLFNNQDMVVVGPNDLRR